MTLKTDSSALEYLDEEFMEDPSDSYEPQLTVVVCRDNEKQRNLPVQSSVTITGRILVSF